MWCRGFAGVATKTPVRWTDAKAGDLYGVTVLGPAPGLVWAHGLGGSCKVDDIRGVGELLRPSVLGRTVLRLDLRGHGRSSTTHCSERAAFQYTWGALAEDMRHASQASTPGAFFGGEGMGAAVALQAAIASITDGSPDAPPGLVLMRPPRSLVEDLLPDVALIQWRERCEALACASENGGWDAVESLEKTWNCMIDGLDAGYSETSGAGSLILQNRRTMDARAYAAALRGHLSSTLPTKMLKVLQKSRHSDMADDAYGVPLKFQCPVLVLAVEGSSDNGVETAEKLAGLIPNSELVVAANLQEAYAGWASKIRVFSRKALMNEFLTSPVWGGQ